VIHAPSGNNEKDGSGKCRLATEADVATFEFETDDFGAWKTKFDEGYYYATVFMPLQGACASVGLAGSWNARIDGAFTYNIPGILYGVSADAINTEDVDIFGEPTGFKSWHKVFLHEMIHILGAGFHSAMKVCSEQTTSMKCTYEEYGDKYDVLGTGNAGYGINLNAKIRYDMGWLDG
jgi:hypothetical protein